MMDSGMEDGMDGRGRNIVENKKPNRTKKTVLVLPPDERIVTRGSLEAALNARKNESIGQILNGWDSYKTGDFVFLEPQGNGCWVVSMPMTSDEIDKQKNRGSALRDWLAIINVPNGFAKIVLKGNYK